MNINVNQQWDLLMSQINSYIKTDRKTNLIKMYEALADRILTAPASSHSTRHNCFPGGYVDHVNRVISVAIKLHGVWQELGANTSTYTLEEVVFSALNHDLGKVGSSTKDYYIPNDSDWHVKRGQIYKINPELTFMKVPDRSIFLLQEYQIPFSENEYLAIKLHDGLYSKGNESYLMAGQPEFALKSDLPILIHHSDHLATLIEAAMHAENYDSPTKTKVKMSTVNDPVADAGFVNLFNDLFGKP